MERSIELVQREHGELAVDAHKVEAEGAYNALGANLPVDVRDYIESTLYEASKDRTGRDSAVKLEEIEILALVDIMFKSRFWLENVARKAVNAVLAGVDKDEVIAEFLEHLDRRYTSNEWYDTVEGILARLNKEVEND